MNEQQLRDMIAQTEATKVPGYQSILKALRRRLQELILDKQTTASGINKDPDSGLFIAPDGRSYATLAEAEMALEEEERKGKLDTAKAESQQSIEELERLIKASGAKQTALAERVGARQQGQLLSQLERSILGSGGDAQVVGALTPQIQEQGERSLLDRVQGIEADTLGRLTQVPQLELGNITDMAQLGQTQQRISDARTQALMNEETQRATIQAEIDSQPEWWEKVLAPVAQATGTYLALSSDIRVKENISQVGLLDNGLPVYLFNYKGNKTPQIGLMAQDVEKVNKDAVVEIDGIKRVYYGKAVK
tara:strand:- start:5076 stop:5996 length:921 start_codon:yes stop_codon:yes gene_type:complete